MSNRDGNEEDESFFVSMTDIMVGLLFIFILIIMFFAVQAKIDAETIEEREQTIEEQEQQLSIFGDEGELAKYSQLTEYQLRVALQRKNLLNWIKVYLSNSGVDGVEVIQEQGVIRLPEGILFDSGAFSFEEGSPAEVTAKVISSALNDILPCSVMTADGRPYRSQAGCDGAFYHNRRMGFVQAIYVEGHTDDEAVGVGGLPGDSQLTSNLKLSARRSTNTLETMTKESPNIILFHGPVLGESRLRFEPVLASAAYGEWRPAVKNDSEDGRRANRRIDLRIVMYVPPNIDALKQLVTLVGRLGKPNSGKP